MPFVIGPRKALRVALDWTEYDRDVQATIALDLLTSHGRATPLVWQTVRKSEVKDRQGQYENEVIERLHELLSEDVQVDAGRPRLRQPGTLSAHGGVRLGFCDRFREDVLVESDEGDSKPAAEWVPKNGRDALVTADRTHLGAVVLSATHIKDPSRRDRLLVLAAFAQGLLTLLGAASEAAGLDRYLKANTVKRRTRSLFRQGTYWYSALPNLREERLRPLMEAFGQIVSEHDVSREILGVI